MCHKYYDHARDIICRLSVSGTVHAIIVVSIVLKFQIQPAVCFEYSYAEVIFMYKTANKTKRISLYMEYLGMQIGDPTVHHEDKQIYITIVKAKSFILRVKNIGMPV